VIFPDLKTPSVPLTLILKFVLLVSSKLIWESFGGVEVVPNPTVVIPVIKVFPITVSLDDGVVVPIPRLPALETVTLVTAFASLTANKVLVSPVTLKS
jgi:hypothetical protein